MADEIKKGSDVPSLFTARWREWDVDVCPIEPKPSGDVYASASRCPVCTYALLTSYDSPIRRLVRTLCSHPVNHKAARE